MCICIHNTICIYMWYICGVYVWCAHLRGVLYHREEKVQRGQVGFRRMVPEVFVRAVEHHRMGAEVLHCEL
jgi:hypothetical protein